MDSSQIISLLSGIEGFVFPRNAEFGTYFILYCDNGRRPQLFRKTYPVKGKAGQPWGNINILVSSHEEHIYVPEMRAFVEKWNRNGQ